MNESFSFPATTEDQKDAEKIESTKERLKELLGLMIAKIGVDIPEEDWPEIRLSPAELGTSAYNSQENLLFIHPKHLDDGITYGEECGHFIRHFIEKNNQYPSIEDKDFQMAVDEFFGRLGENIAREVASSTPVAEAFHLEERDFLGDIEEYRKLREELSFSKPLIEELKKKVENNREVKKSILKKIKGFYLKIEKAVDLCLEAQKKNVPADDLLRQIEEVVYPGEAGMEDLSVFSETLVSEDQYPEWAKGLFNVFNSGQENVGKIKSLVADQGTIFDFNIYSYIENYLGFIKSSCDFEIFDLTNPNFELMLYIRKAESSLYHTVGYAAGERFMLQNPDWISSPASVFNLSNQEVFDRYIASEDFVEWLKNNQALSGLAERIELLKEIEDALYLEDDEEG